MAMVLSLPNFNQIHIADVKENLETLLKKNLDTIQSLLDKQSAYTWENLLQPIEDLNGDLHEFWGPVQHLSSVVNTPELRDVVNACLPILSDYQAHISHNEKLFHAIESIHQSPVFATLNAAQQKSIEQDLRDFKLGGVHLPSEQKIQFAEINKKLAQLSHQFEENLLDATMAFKKHIVDEAQLTGIPDHAKSAAKNAAKKENLEGWLFSLEAPDYIAIMSYADSSALREEFYRAYVTRASELEAGTKKHDNSKNIEEILKNRFALARLLGFNNFAEYSLATKMVKKTSDVLAFLNELAEKTTKAAQAEFDALTTFAKQTLGFASLNAWDIAYVSEKFRQKEYAISPEDLRPYFPEPHVLQGLFTIAQRLYGITFERVDNAAVWHKDVKCFRLVDTQKNLVAHLFFDLYARDNKRGGAWMDDCAVRRRLNDDDILLPAAYVTCNFNAPIGNDPALFTHDDVVTLFHECGHALQHVLTKIDVANVSGIHGIPWDAVEVASQFFENWAWEKESIAYFAKHYQTNATLPDELFNKMDRAKNFQSAMQMMRQLELALFDFRLHMEYNEHTPDCVQNILNDVRKKVAVFKTPDFNRFQHGFAHIFGGSYAAGYYSYKWAEVMACDAFSLCQEKGIFDTATNERYKKTFLESGGAIDPLDVFIAFRGRAPIVDPLLEQSGIHA
jgi:oligopeptidase A